MHIARPIPGPSILRKRSILAQIARLDGATFLDPYADVFGDRPAFFTDTELALPGADPDRLTYEEVRRYTARIAAAYLSIGLRPGDAVAFITLNRLELAMATFAALRAGMVAVPLNYMLTRNEVITAIRRSGAKLLVSDRATVEARGLAAAGLERVMLLDSTDAQPGTMSLPALLASSDAEAPPASVNPDDPALIFFTSGTTGEPKGATIPHRSLARVIRRQAKAGALIPTPRNQLGLLVMPLAHNGGFMSVVIELCLGVPSLVLSRFDPRGVLELIERIRPTIFTGTPAMYRMLLEAGAEGFDLSSIRVWGGGADVFPRELLDRLRALGGWRRFGIRFRPFTMIGYGSAETAGQVTISPPVPIGDRCIGWVLPGFERRIVDEGGHDVGRGESGELLLRGGTLMSGYWEDRDRTEATMPGGWFRTGDIVRRGPLGLLFYESRNKDVIKSGGYSVSALEIEQVLEEHPSVQQAAAVGLPDPIKGEQPVAAVVLRVGGHETSPEELELWAAERMAAYKRPRRVYVVDKIPVTSTFKPRKHEVRREILRRDAE